jgi:hypothetical protein
MKATSAVLPAAHIAEAVDAAAELAAAIEKATPPAAEKSAAQRRLEADVAASEELADALEQLGRAYKAITGRPLPVEAVELPQLSSAQRPSFQHYFPARDALTARYAWLAKRISAAAEEIEALF